MDAAARWTSGFPGLPAWGGAGGRAGAGGDGDADVDGSGGDEDGGEDDEDGVAVRFAKLLATLATEIMDSLKRVENGEGRARRGQQGRRGGGEEGACRCGVMLNRLS